MANEKKSSMKETIAEVKVANETIRREAKTRVAAAWTIAKTMLPSAPPEVQKMFASSLLTNKTSALVAALKQTAKNAQYTKIAETFKEVHKVEMNDLLEDPSGRRLPQPGRRPTTVRTPGLSPALTTMAVATVVGLPPSRRNWMPVRPPSVPVPVSAPVTR
jgi:hypothetical protein